MGRLDCRRISFHMLVVAPGMPKFDSLPASRRSVYAGALGAYDPIVASAGRQNRNNSGQLCILAFPGSDVGAENGTSNAYSSVMLSPTARMRMGVAEAIAAAITRASSNPHRFSMRPM